MSHKDRLTPRDLWLQSNGNRDRYLALLREHGHLVPGHREPGTDIFGHPNGKRIRADVCPFCGGTVLAPESVAVHIERVHPEHGIEPLIDPIHWSSAVDTSEMKRVGLASCQWRSPEGWPCLATEREHDGAWAFGHHYQGPE